MILKGSLAPCPSLTFIAIIFLVHFGQLKDLNLAHLDIW